VRKPCCGRIKKPPIKLVAVRPPGIRAIKPGRRYPGDRVTVARKGGRRQEKFDHQHFNLFKAPSLRYTCTPNTPAAVMSPSSKESVASKNQEQILQTDIREILSAYKNNEVGADNRYKGKQIQVTGVVDDIKKDLFGSLYVTLGTGAQFEIPQIQAFFDDSMNNQLAQLTKGQQLTVVCRVDGLMMNVLAKNCIIR
jgi:hypothetical protein